MQVPVAFFINIVDTDRSVKRDDVYIFNVYSHLNDLHEQFHTSTCLISKKG